jgi:AcrR family transcriptional regulator
VSDGRRGSSETATPNMTRRVDNEAGVDREGGSVLEMQRRRLLLGFTEVLAEGGLENASVGRVCKRVGVSRRTFYDLFDDREACFLAVLDSTVERLSRSVRPVYEGEGRWRERIRGALAVVFDFFEEQPALARVCVVEAFKAGPAVMERRRGLLEALAAAVDEGRGEAKARIDPPPLTAQSTVGGAVSVVYARMLAGDTRPLSELLNPVMSMIVHPYLGPVAARRELESPVPIPKSARDAHAPSRAHDPFRGLSIRITFRTARVLAAIDAHPGTNNRQVGDTAGIPDQGQISKLLNRLRDCGLIENDSQGHANGVPNAWRLTNRGQAIQHAIEMPAA